MMVVQSVVGLLPRCMSGLAVATLWGWIFVIAFCGTFSHYCIARAMRYADATVVVPMDFLRVPLTATVGWLLYSERLDAGPCSARADPVRQSAESEADRAGSRPRA